MDFAVPVDHKVKIKGSENLLKYLDLARELKEAVKQKRDSNTDSSWGPYNKSYEPGKQIQ